MNDLLGQAIAAHGGLDAWRGMTSCVARLSIDGAIWRMKGVPDVFRSVELAVDLNTQHVRMVSVTDDWESAYSPDLVVIRDRNGRSLEKLGTPRDAFNGRCCIYPVTAWRADVYAQ
jgi:hypothetical protein